MDDRSQPLEGQIVEIASQAFVAVRGRLAMADLDLSPVFDQQVRSIAKRIDAQGLTAGTGPWESYVDDPSRIDDPSQVRTEACWPSREP